MLLLYYKMMFIQAFTFLFYGFSVKGKGYLQHNFSCFSCLIIKLSGKGLVFFGQDTRQTYRKDLLALLLS